MSFQHFHIQSKLTAWYPTNIPGCLLWLDASQGITKDASDYISVWADQSGNGNNATQSTGSSQPLWVDNQLNGKPVIRFDGINDFLNGTTIAGLGTSELNMFIITKGNIQAQNNAHGMIFGINNYNNGMWITRASKKDSFGNLYNYLNNIAFYTPDYVEFGNYFYYKMLEIQHIPNISTKLINNNIQEVSAICPQFTNSNYYIGYGGLIAQTPYSGDIAEIIIYDNALSDSNRKIVGQYLNNKYTTPFIVNEIPIMTSDTTPSGKVTYSSAVGGTYGYMVFDNNASTFWNTVTPAWLNYELPVAKKFTSYYIKPSVLYNMYVPYDWTIQASNDGVNWTILDTRTAQLPHSGNAYSFTNNNFYTNYKIVITSAYLNNPTISTLMFSE